MPPFVVAMEEGRYGLCRLRADDDVWAAMLGSCGCGCDACFEYGINLTLPFPTPPTTLSRDSSTHQSSSFNTRPRPSTTTSSSSSTGLLFRSIYRKILTTGCTIFTGCWWPEKGMRLTYKINSTEKNFQSGKCHTKWWVTTDVHWTDRVMQRSVYTMRRVGCSGGVWPIHECGL